MSSVNQWTHDWALSQSLESQFLPETTSTNDIAKTQFSNGSKDFMLIVTDHQSQGRGRYDRTWTNAQKGQGLSSTWCFRKPFVAQPILTPLLGLEVFKALKKMHSPFPLSLKPPNDILLDNGKLCGLLVEAVSLGQNNEIFIGLGMNVLSSPEIDIETSHLAIHKDVSEELWAGFCQTLFKGFQEAIEKSQSPELSEQDCNDILYALNKEGQNNDYQVVHPNGGLVKDEQTLFWHDL